MNKNNDISALFQQFEGDAREYQEFVQDAHTAEARARWPLISTISATTLRVPPPCVDGNTGLVVAPIVAESIRPSRERALPVVIDTAVEPAPRKSLCAGLARFLAWSGRRVRA